MKKLIKQIMIFGSIASIGYPVIVFFLFINNTKLPNVYDYCLTRTHLSLRLQEAENYGAVDVLFLGSSHAYRGFDTRFFNEKGYSCFNLGSSAQTPKQTLLLVKEYLYRFKPKIVVLEVNPMYLSSKGLESTLDIIRNAPSHKLKLKTVWGSANMLTFNSYLISSLSSLTSIGRKEVKNGEEDRYISGGFSLKKKRFHSPHKYQAKTRYEIREEQVNCLNEVYKEIENTGAKVVFAEAPVTKKFYSQYSRLAFEELFKDWDYVNFNEKIILNDSLDFYDSHHMNLNGVRKFNELVIKKVEKLKLY